jgi:hypothetical protein
MSHQMAGLGRFPGIPGGEYPGRFMASDSNGESFKPMKFTEILSQKFLKPAKPKADQAPPSDPEKILEPAERKAAMGGLDAVELKWSRAGLTLAGLSALFLSLYLSATHGTRKVTLHIHGKSVPGTVPIASQWLLIGAIALVFSGLGFLAIRRRKRTLVAFTCFVLGLIFIGPLFIYPLGFALIFLGGWLMIRAYRLQKYGTANAKVAARQAASRPPRAARKQAAKAPPKPTGYKAPTPNKRYTPKAKTRKKVIKPAE